MPGFPNKLSQFWQELKRRKVTRTITVYAATAFVILELVDILAPSLGLPGWTLNLVLILLIVGFVIAVILSWIYDIHPEGGIVKTEPAEEVKPGDIAKTSNSWKIASYISIVVIVGLIVLNIIPRANNKKILEKSIAVLPFRNDSPEQERMYFINGTMEAILDNLCKIEDLRVPGRTSVEQYRDNPKPIPVVAEEMNVSYVLEGSGHRDGNNVRLFVQLLDGRNDQHLWSKSYDTDIDEIFSMQSEIAQLVASEIEAIITPEEKQLIEKIPTSNLTAHDFYQRGREKYEQYRFDYDNKEALKRAEYLYNKALDYDSAFALAYIGLAEVYLEKHSWDTFLNENYLDSMLILADIALSFDDQLAEAYAIRGIYYRRNYKEEQAIKEYNRAIKLNPNNWETYYQKANLYGFSDLVQYIDNLQKAASLQRGPRLPGLYRGIGGSHATAGFKEKGINYVKEALKLDDDSASYYFVLASIEDAYANFDKAVEYFEKSYAIDSTDAWNTFALGNTLLFNGQYEESLKYMKEVEKALEAYDNFNHWTTFYVGYAYWINGFKEAGEYYFNIALEFHNEMIELGRYYGNDFHLFIILAAVHAFLGDKDKAYENLRLLNQMQGMPIYLIKNIKNDPLFNNIRDEPEFQQIVRDIEAKYQAEHERVRQWLEENDML